MSSQICDDRSQRVFFAQMTSCTMRYDVICHPFPIKSQYLKKWGELTALQCIIDPGDVLCPAVFVKTRVCGGCCLAGSQNLPKVARILYLALRIPFYFSLRAVLRLNYLPFPFVRYRLLSMACEYSNLVPRFLSYLSSE